MSILDAFLDGVTGAGLFGKLNWPGAPTELVDTRKSSDFGPKLAAKELRISQRPTVTALLQHVKHGPGVKQ
jgi:hypothetical protein